MRLDELHKFSGGNLQSVHKTLPDRLQNLSLGFNPKSDIPNRAWTTKDQDCIVTILKKIDVVLLKRRIMRSLEVLVSGKTTKTESYDPIILGKYFVSQNQRDLPKDIPLDSIEVLRYATKGVKVGMGIMRTKTELTLE
nr:hypothetical protein [Tanacetum cinerariifolium]